MPWQVKVIVFVGEKCLAQVAVTAGPKIVHPPALSDQLACSKPDRGHSVSNQSILGHFCITQTPIVMKLKLAFALMITLKLQIKKN